MNKPRVSLVPWTLAGVSIGLNVFLAVAWLRHSAVPPTPGGKSKEVPADTAILRRAELRTNQASHLTARARAAKLDWRAVESEDYKTYIANLRAIGCPEETLRDIVAADVGKLFRSRRKTFLNTVSKYEYWKTGSNPTPELTEEQRRQMTEISRAEREAVGSLLGAGAVEPHIRDGFFGDVETAYQRALSFLDKTKRNEVLEILNAQAEKQYELFGDGFRQLGGDDLKKIETMEAETDAKLAQILTPEQKEELAMRNSDTASHLREQLKSFEPSEAEFRTIFHLQKQFDDAFGKKEDGPAKEQAKNELASAIRSVLDAQRFSDYQHAIAPSAK